MTLDTGEFRFRKVNLEKIKDMIKKQYIPYGLNVLATWSTTNNSFTPLDANTKLHSSNT